MTQIAKKHNVPAYRIAGALKRSNWSRKPHLPVDLEPADVERSLRSHQPPTPERQLLAYVAEGPVVSADVEKPAASPASQAAVEVPAPPVVKVGVRFDETPIDTTFPPMPPMPKVAPLSPKSWVSGSGVAFQERFSTVMDPAEVQARIQARGWLGRLPVVEPQPVEPTVVVEAAPAVEVVPEAVAPETVEVESAPEVVEAAPEVVEAAPEVVEAAPAVEREPVVAPDPVVQPAVAEVVVAPVEPEPTVEVVASKTEAPAASPAPVVVPDVVQAAPPVAAPSASVARAVEAVSAAAAPVAPASPASPPAVEAVRPPPSAQPATVWAWRVTFLTPEGVEVVRVGVAGNLVDLSLRALGTGLGEPIRLERFEVGF